MHKRGTSPFLRPAGIALPGRFEQTRIPFQAGLHFFNRRFYRKDGFECRCKEPVPGIPPSNEPVGKPYRRITCQLAVGQRQGLLGQNRFRATITFLGVGIVECLQELVQVLRLLLEIEAPAHRRVFPGRINRRTANGQVQRAREVKHAVADRLSIQPLGCSSVHNTCSRDPAFPSAHCSGRTSRREACACANV